MAEGAVVRRARSGGAAQGGPGPASSSVPMEWPSLSQVGAAWQGSSPNTWCVQPLMCPCSRTLTPPAHAHAPPPTEEPLAPPPGTAGLGPGTRLHLLALPSPLPHLPSGKSKAPGHTHTPALHLCTQPPCRIHRASVPVLTRQTLCGHCSTLMEPTAGLSVQTLCSGPPTRRQGPPSQSP